MSTHAIARASARRCPARLARNESFGWALPQPSPISVMQRLDPLALRYFSAATGPGDTLRSLWNTAPTARMLVDLAVRAGVPTKAIMRPLWYAAHAAWQALRSLPSRYDDGPEDGLWELSQQLDIATVRHIRLPRVNRVDTGGEGGIRESVRYAIEALGTAESYVEVKILIEAAEILEDVERYKTDANRSSVLQQVHQHLHWALVAVALDARRVDGERVENLGEPLWVSVTADLVPEGYSARTVRAREHLLEQMEPHAHQIEQIAREMGRAGVWRREVLKPFVDAARC